MHMHMAHRAVNAQIESMFSFNLEISNPAVMACDLLRLLHFHEYACFEATPSPSATKDV